MLKFKKILLAMMVAAIAVTGFVSCSSDDDDDDTPEYAQYYGDYSGSMTVTMKTATTVSLTANVAENSITLSGNYGTYTPVFWFKDSDSKWVVAGRAKANTETDVTADNYTDKSVCGVYITFGDSVVMTIPAMAAMGGTSTLTKSE